MQTQGWEETRKKAQRDAREGKSCGKEEAIFPGEVIKSDVIIHHGEGCIFRCNGWFVPKLSSQGL